MDIKKIEENMYEIPKEGKMLVPGRVFASEKVLAAIKEDKSLEQVKNVAHLKGIQDYSIALTDCHQGYGFCIGGVAAFDLNQGVITPGGIGFDINCTHPEEKVSLSNGTWIKIKDLERDWRKHFPCFSELKEFNINKTNISCFMKRKEQGALYRIASRTGESIRVTGDHPIYTEKGMKNAQDLSLSDKIAIYSFQGNRYEKPTERIILTEKEVELVLEQLQITSEGNAKKQVLNRIKEQITFPLRYDSKEIPFLLKIMGFLFGDGSITINADKNGQIQFYAEHEDLLKLKNDFKNNGFACNNVYTRKRNHKISSFYGTTTFTHIENSINKKSTGFVAILIALGCPYGIKTKTKYRVPKWIFNAPLWQKRLFLSAFFGAEMSSPKTLNRYNFYQPQLGMNKNHEIKENAIDFLNDIRLLLSEFNIQTSSIVEVPGYQYKGKNGLNIGFRLKILNNPKNLLNFFEKIGYEYNKKKQKKACLAINYIKLKEKAVEERKEIRIKAIKMHEEKIPMKQIVSTLEGKYTTEQFIRHTFSSRKNGKVRVAFNFMSFEEYCKKYSLGEDGFAWDEIEKIEKIPYEGWVYDFTMNCEDHNFIANNIVVSNCGVRLLKTNLKKEEIINRQEEVVQEMYRKIPSGVGRGSRFNMTKQELDEVLKGGAQRLVEKGYGTEADYLHMEDEGKLPADPSKVSQRAKKRGIGQLGTLGAGNHFLEIQYVEQLFDEKTATAFGLEPDQVVIMIHCGSRGLGHQVASDYIKKMEEAYGFEGLPDRELINAPIDSQLGQEYLLAMGAAANFAFANRQLITHWTREEFKHLFPNSTVEILYDVCHNIAKIESYDIEGVQKNVCVHRKGATRSLGVGRKEIPKAYRTIGQPVLIPGSMGTASYVLVGAKKAEAFTFGSTVHGAGRVMSRSKAIKSLKGETIKEELKAKGILVQSGSVKGIAEEAPSAYKDVDEVVNVVDTLGISKKVARLRPLVVVKG